MFSFNSYEEFKEYIEKRGFAITKRHRIVKLNNIGLPEYCNDKGMYLVMSKQQILSTVFRKNTNTIAVQNAFRLVFNNQKNFFTSVTLEYDWFHVGKDTYYIEYSRAADCPYSSQINGLDFNGKIGVTIIKGLEMTNFSILADNKKEAKRYVEKLKQKLRKEQREKRIKKSSTAVTIED